MVRFGRGSRLSLAGDSIASVVTTLAGLSGSGRGFTGDVVKATDARFGFGFDVAAHPDGSVWIADCNNHRVRRLGADGFVRTMAGDGVGLITGDGGPAAAAQVACPLGIEVGPDGSVYFVDDFVVIRRIGTDGIIRRIAGALATTIAGAVPSLPTRDAVEQLLASE